MTDAKALADALVEAGIVDRHCKEGLLLGLSYNVSPSALVNDWRIAGKCLETMWPDVVAYPDEFVQFVNDRIYEGMSTPRAIIEAWYAAVEEKGDE